MKTFDINDFYRGWYVGDFQPTCYQTKEFEVGYLFHPKGEIWPAHYHKLATEINLLIDGEMVLDNKRLKTGDIFVLEPNEIAEPTFLTDCKIIVIKTPSVPGDKYVI